jgi:hypothetical protein
MNSGLENNLICTVILDVLHNWHNKQRGYWYGYARLIDDVKYRIGKEITIKEAKKALQQLRKQGLVSLEAVYKEHNGMLNGSGYFYNKL